MKIAVIGTGYVGLVTGTCLAEMGNTVVCIDVDEAKVKKMQAGKTPIYEPDLNNLFSRNIHEKRLSFTTDTDKGIKSADVIFLALPTPPGEDGSADLSYIFSVADRLGETLDHYVVIVDKSTVPVGTANLVKQRLAKRAQVDFDVVSNPEFLREGFAIRDFMKPDRIIIGTTSKHARKTMETLYKPFVRQGNHILFMDERSAEMTKYAANAFLATKISFMNEIANLCELIGADVGAVRLGIGSDERIGKRFLFPGIGYGGSCLPKDVQALYHTAKENEYNFRILEAITEVNADQKQLLFNKVKRYFGDKLEGKSIAVWGLAFKPDTDDIREAPSLEIIRKLLDAGMQVKAYDPEATDNAKKYFKSEKALSFVDDEYAALKDAKALLIATEWSEFRAPDFAKMKQLMALPVIFDGRNLYDPEEVAGAGFYYESIGRKTVGGHA